VQARGEALLRLPQLHPRLAVVGELHAGGFEGKFDRLSNAGGRQLAPVFKCLDGAGADARRAGQLILRPAKRYAGRPSLARAKCSFHALKFGSRLALSEYDAGGLERELDVRERLTVGRLFAGLKAYDRPGIYAARAADIILGPFEQLASSFHLGAGDGHSKRLYATRGEYSVGTSAGRNRRARAQIEAPGGREESKRSAYRRKSRMGAALGFTASLAGPRSTKSTTHLYY
jgi:hypothetical protein